MFHERAVGSLQPTFEGIVQQDLNVTVPVGAALLMVEAQGVEELVLHCSIINAAWTLQR